MDNISYSEDGTTITWKNYLGKVVEIPVAFLDELSGHRRRVGNLNDILEFRNISRPSKPGNKVSIISVPISELEGVDLTGAICGIYFSNWEDSEWMYTTEAVTVIKDESYADSYPRYRFKFTDEIEEAHAKENQYDEEDEDFNEDENRVEIPQLMYSSWEDYNTVRVVRETESEGVQ
jgi:hypothetical protein